ncbi:MAG TPA: serine/threonine-protein kinase, partial [Gemmatimonadales bacterium]|nr:serine/threonine-protein kinase [Gemmatimonadales bacterium]
VLLVDFGIAKQVGGSATNLTQTGFVVGTPYYMSPEQALGQGDVDNRTDIYAVGAMLFQMVTGAPPFEGESSQEIVGKHLSEPVPVPATVNTKIPVWLSDVILRCLAKRAADRFQNCGQVLSALDAGRESGGSQSISAERVAARIKADDVTAAMPTPVPAPAVASAPTVRTAAAKPAAAKAPAAPAKSGPGPMLIIGGVLVLLVGLMTFRWLNRPILTIENRLADPVRITWNSSNWDLKPGERREFAIPRRKPLVAQWYLVQPTCPDGGAMGLALQGTIEVERPSGRIHRSVDMWSADKPAFAPLITNGSDQSLSVRINAGLQGGVDLHCRVTPGATRVHIGYYPLFGNSSVEVAAPDGRKASFHDLGPQVTDRLAGTLGLQFETRDLH